MKDIPLWQKEIGLKLKNYLFIITAICNKNGFISLYNFYVYFYANLKSFKRKVNILQINILEKLLKSKFERLF